MAGEWPFERSRRPLYLRTGDGAARHGLETVHGERVQLVNADGTADVGDDPEEPLDPVATVGIHQVERVEDYQEGGLRIWRYVNALYIATVRVQAVVDGDSSPRFVPGRYVRFPDSAEPEVREPTWFLVDSLPDGDGWTRFPLQKYG